MSVKQTSNFNGNKLDQRGKKFDINLFHKRGLKKEQTDKKGAFFYKNASADFNRESPRINLFQVKKEHLLRVARKLFFANGVIVCKFYTLTRIFHTGSSRGAANLDADKEDDGLR
jgi:hypothetical protein